MTDDKVLIALKVLEENGRQTTEHVSQAVDNEYPKNILQTGTS